MDESALRHLGFYRELSYGDPAGGSIHDAAALDAEVKRHVLIYLRDAPVLAASGVLATDYFSGDALGPFYLHTDGRWIWYSDLPHYVEHHDCPLPADFVSTAEVGSPPDLSDDDLVATANRLHPQGSHDAQPDREEDT